ncbi:hypothetical protein K6X05_000470 [Enterococcus faecalis]|nr:hypothetical protein [Enterococcus faecalis]
MVKDAAYIIGEITTILEGTYFVITKKANKRRMCLHVSDTAKEFLRCRLEYETFLEQQFDYATRFLETCTEDVSVEIQTGLLEETNYQALTVEKLQQIATKM